MKVAIRLAEICDENEIVQFIADYWSSEHVFVKNRAFFRYEMCSNGRPNFIIAKMDERIVGVLGFLQYGKCLQESDLFLVIFQSIKQKSAGNIGLGLIEYAKSLTNRNLHSVGVNPGVVPYYRFLGFQTGVMDHFFWLNQNVVGVETFLVDELSQFNWDRLTTGTPVGSLVVQTDFAQITKLANQLTPISCNLKSSAYFIKRFLENPIYEYKVLALYQEGPGQCGIGVVREINVAQHRAYRLVDWIGGLEHLASFCALLIDLASSEGMAFIDLYISGLEENVMDMSGMLKVDNSVVIPNYLEPLVMENKMLHYVTTGKEPPVFMRGDGDQDRPSRG